MPDITTLIDRVRAAEGADREPLTRDELLVLLIEECGEVIQAATKCLRFGFDSHHIPEYGVNSKVLAKEAGDLLAVIHELPLDFALMNQTASIKIAKAERANAQYGTALSEGANSEARRG